MSEEPSALTVIEAAPLPEGFKTKAAKFLLRFIAGTFGHPALQAAQDNLDTVAGRTKVSAALADAVAKEVITDPVQMERARARFLGETIRKQENVEAVAHVAAEEIAKEPENPSEEPADDWLNIFTRYAEDASSERAQRLWGRVLAGEFRAAGSISPRTLRLLAELDQQTADDFEQVVGLITNDFIFRPPDENRGEPLVRLMRLETAGLVTLGGGFVSRSITPEGAGLTLIVKGDPLSLAGKFAAGASIAVPCANLTVAGIELARLIRRQVTTRGALLRLADFLKTKGAEKLVLGHVVRPGHMDIIETIHG
jgi:hypothetical protein